jgi:Uncharacterized protein conserved in cyanobacteria
MVTTVALEHIEILPGQRLCLHYIDWDKFEEILEALGDRRTSRIAYYQHTLEIRMPLPEHERIKCLLSYLLVELLDYLGMEWESLGSTTYKKRKDLAGIEPDDCFYIQNYRSAVGMLRVDLDRDPPPDLAIEVDLTSKHKSAPILPLAYLKFGGGSAPNCRFTFCKMVHTKNPRPAVFSPTSQ